MFGAQKARWRLTREVPDSARPRIMLRVGPDLSVLWRKTDHALHVPLVSLTNYCRPQQKVHPEALCSRTSSVVR
jgi:hypothetical protein